MGGGEIARTKNETICKNDKHCKINSEKKVFFRLTSHKFSACLKSECLFLTSLSSLVETQVLVTQSTLALVVLLLTAGTNGYC